MNSSLNRDFYVTGTDLTMMIDVTLIASHGRC